jgi:2-iminobutanoate/2-iminopropanoate deaminase
MTLTLKRISIATAPAPGGAYSQAVAANGFLFTAGMAPIDPATGEVVGDDVAGQTRQVMRNLQQLLEAEGLGFSDVVKATVHLQDVHRDFAGYNQVYESFFSDGLPVRTTVGSTLLNILVEIDFVAAYPEVASA